MSQIPLPKMVEADASSIASSKAQGSFPEPRNGDPKGVKSERRDPTEAMTPQTKINVSKITSASTPDAD